MPASSTSGPVSSDEVTTAHPSDQAPWTVLGGDLPPPVDPQEATDLLWQQLAAQFRWYDTRAFRARLAYYVLKVLALVLAAAVTVLAAVEAPGAVTAALAAGIVVLEGVQQVFQFHANWISYRAVAEALRQHAFRYTASVDPYADRATRRNLLAQAMHSLTSSENAAWASTMRQAATPVPTPAPDGGSTDSQPDG